jgi:hypothetical protein
MTPGAEIVYLCHYLLRHEDACSSRRGGKTGTTVSKVSPGPHYFLKKNLKKNDGK